MEVVEENNNIPVDNANVAECNFCAYTFHRDMPHLSCKMIHNNPQSARFEICQACFYQWIHGEVRSDNVGFQRRRCACGTVISFDDVKNILSPYQFEMYDEAMTKAMLEKDPKVLYCPGTDCGNAFYKPKKTKRPCRRAECDECKTLLCCQCGELYTKDHQRMKCGPYKKWKQTHDAETIAMKQWKDSASAQGKVKKCPGCRRDVEKNVGCNGMKCTNCRTRFCWACNKRIDSQNRCGC
jgi:hypothetical protein